MIKEENNYNFEERYKNLNSEQRLAVDSIEGPVMVVAGPGTGKTEILTLRIANILKKTDTMPENILALTFTESATSNMRRRLSKMIGSSGYRVNIKTFHGFCNDIIKDYPEYFPTIIGSGNITEVESLSILTELINTLPLVVLRPWGEPLHYIRDIYKKMEDLKREGLTPNDFMELVSREEKDFTKRNDLYYEKGMHKGKMKGEHKKFEKLLLKNKELALVYSEYRKVLHTRRLYDWSDMIMEVLNALKSKEDLKLILQENYQYILVDEHQDTNNAQNKILELLCDFHKDPNIFIVGDEKQAIFRFQGGGVLSFSYFKKLYPQAKLIELFQNYRSHQDILDTAHSLIQSKIPLTAKGKISGAEIFVAQFKNKNNEIYFLAERINDLIKSGVMPKEIAVIYRANKEAFFMADALEKVNVPYSIESDEDLLSEKYVRRFITLLSAIYHFGDDKYLTPALHLDESGVDILSAYKLIVRAGKERKSLYDLLVQSEDIVMSGFALKLKVWTKAGVSEHLSQFLEQVLRESGILSAMLASKSADAFLGISKLFEEAKRISANRPGAGFSDFMEFISTIQTHNLFLKRPKHDPLQAVRLMTAHRSKGLEFEYVHIIGANENSFGPKANHDHLALLSSVYKMTYDDITDEDTTADERRLFYVALTRAKKSIFISYSSIDENGREVLASPFVLDIREDKKSTFDTTEFEKKIEIDPSPLFARRTPNPTNDISQSFVTELFRSHPLSVSALNNYISCPWKYFYRNLLRIPSSPERHQIYGTAMHSAVEDLWRVMTEREPSKEFLTDSYKRHLGLLGILTETEFNEALIRGNKSLSGWFDSADPHITDPVIVEFNIPGVELTPDVVLSGKLDKVVMVSSSRALVTDYKTGKQKSRNHILGEIKNGTGDVIRQLQFYKLILSLHDNIEMEKGIIEFLEPNDDGKYRREEFDVSGDEVEELKKIILNVSKEITTLAFWDKTCDDKTCQYCGFRKLL